MTENVNHTDFPTIKFAKDGIVRYAKTRYKISNYISYENHRYSDGNGPNSKTSKEFSFNFNNFDNIIIGFVYDLCLQHTWNKKDSKSIYGGYIAGNPISEMIDFYANESWEIRDSIMPTKNIDISSVSKIKETSDFYFEVQANALDSEYKKVWTKRYHDNGYNIRTTDLNYYLKIVDNILYLKEEFDFIGGRGHSRSFAILKRKYKCAVLNYD